MILISGRPYRIGQGKQSSVSSKSSRRRRCANFIHPKKSRDLLCYLAFTMGRQVGCRPTKVVAGHEPEKTNEFLQLLAAAIIDKVVCIDRNPVLTSQLECVIRETAVKR